MRTIISLIGTILALGFLSASVAMNWRFGVSLGRTEFDQWTLGSVSVIADLFKATLPFFISWSIRNTRVTVSVAAGVLWMLCAAYSVTSGLGFAAMNRSGTTTQRADASFQYKDLRGALGRAQRRLEALGTPRPTATVKAELARARTDATWARTEKCTDATATTSRTFCQAFHALEGELASARTAGDIRQEIVGLNGDLNKARDNGLQDNADPQAGILSRLLRIDLSTISMSLVVLVAVLVELGSGLGLFIALNHGGLSGSERMTLDHQRDVVSDGDIAQYAVARLRPTSGQSITFAVLYRDYKNWCASEGLRAENQQPFEDAFGILCELVGFTISGVSGKKTITDMDLVT